MTKKYDYLIYLGRFQPFHKGHYDTVRRALELSQNVIMVLGSHEKPTTFNNPFTTFERMDIIKSALTLEEQARIQFIPQHDHIYNEERWLASIQASVRTVIFGKFNPGPTKIGMVGYDKDHTSYYLKKFPSWELVEIPPFKKSNIIMSATDWRDEYYLTKNSKAGFFVNDVHKNTVLELIESKTVARDEFFYLRNYKTEWGEGPFITADSIVTQSGHILVIRRGKEYARGRLAMPGGFINKKERVIDATVRELKEETDIDIPRPVLYGSISKTNFYDHPDRDARGRIVTFATHFRLQDRDYLPKVKAMDDADEAFWISLAQFRDSRENWFADHYDIIEHMIGI